MALLVKALAQRGFTAARVREQAPLKPEEESFWLEVADELDALEAAAEARSRFRIVLSQISRRSQPAR